MEEKIKGEVTLTQKQQRQLGRIERRERKRRKRQQIPFRRVIPFLIAVIIIIVGVHIFQRWNAPYIPPEGTLSVHFIDVGQGDCIFVSCGGVSMLIDCGEAEYADKVADYLRSQGVKRLDYVAATHPHSDHMGGMYKILEEFPADSVIMPHIDDEDIPTTRFFSRFLDVCAEKDILIKEAQVGEILSIGSASAEIVAPLSEKYSDMNDYSLGIFIRHGKKSFLLTGDAEIPSESEMAESGRLSHADVFKAGHHGSNSSSSYKLLNVITPDHVVISCGKDNSYGHPDEAAVERLSQFTDNIYRTDICGNIIFVSDGENLTVRTERNTNDGDRQI